jgi:hypothetical protein
MLVIRSAIVAAILGASLLHPVPMAADTIPAADSDFDGDGYSDLAVGARGESGGAGAAGSGAVNVLYGSLNGLTSARNQIWSEPSPGLLEVGVTDPFPDAFGTGLATGDFDADGYADLAVGAPGVGTDAGSQQGAIWIIHGSADGLTATGNQAWTPEDLPGLPTDRGWFGRELTSGDFDGDGYADLAIDVPGADPGSLQGQGAVAILFGGANGLDAATAQVFAEGPAGYADGSFGGVLASGDMNGDGRDDLAVAAPQEWVGDRQQAGVVYLFLGTTDGLEAAVPATWTEDTPGVPGTAEHSDHFGGSMAIRDLDRDGSGDLAIGVPGESIGTAQLAGDVTILRGSPGGPTVTGARLWHQSVPGVPGSPEHADGFGAALATGDFDGDGRTDLAVGAPGEAIGKVRCGTLTILYGGPHGLTATDAASLSQDSPGVPGAAESGDAFGATLASANYGKSTRADLAVGVPHEEIGRTAVFAGMVNVLYGASTGFHGAGSQGWSQDSPGVLGVAGSLDDFGGNLTP